MVVLLKKIEFFLCPPLVGFTGRLLWRVPRGTSANRYKVLRRTYVDGHCSFYVSIIKRENIVETIIIAIKFQPLFPVNF